MSEDSNDGYIEAILIVANDHGWSFVPQWNDAQTTVLGWWTATCWIPSFRATPSRIHGHASTELDAIGAYDGAFLWNGGWSIHFHTWNGRNALDISHAYLTSPFGSRPHQRFQYCPAKRAWRDLILTSKCACSPA